jgi:pentatricopeptide repeat protein
VKGSRASVELVILTNPCEPDEWSYTELNYGFCKKRKMESASRLSSGLVDHGLCPNVVTYTTLISGYCKDDKLDCAAQMFEHMKEHGCRLNVQTCNFFNPCSN